MTSAPGVSDSTLPLFDCPHCHAPVGVNDLHCPNCNMNLAVAAIFRERQVLAEMPAKPGEPYVADQNLPRFGDFLLQAGYIDDGQLDSALAKQLQLAVAGTPQTLGQVLLAMGFVTREQLDLASLQQVRQLQAALQESNRELENRVAQRTQELQRALTYLNELNQLKSNFISNVSHELRTPLAHIQGYSQLLRDALGPLNPDQQQAVQVIGQAAGRLSGLIENLLSYATTAQGKMVINPTAFSLAELTDEILERPAMHVTRLRLQLHSHVPSDLPLALADKDKIRWVIEELLDNAIKFTPDGGEVALSVEHLPNMLRISVKDTGVGIASERLEELFAPFHQLDGSTTRRHGGTGLGLALVKDIVRAHGDQVHVESEAGQGSVFSFQIPIAMS